VGAVLSLSSGRASRGAVGAFAHPAPLFLSKIKVLQGHGLQRCSIANAALRKFDDLFRCKSRRRVIADLETESFP
jgi:hypothetical protein